MAAFDPYHKWLGIPPSEQPPTLYRLLGISPFESDPDVIDAAANRQMIYVRGFASGPHAVDSQRILNELSAARLRLLDPRRKMAYDAELRERLNPPSSAPAPAARPEKPNPPPARPRPSPRAEILPATVEPAERQEWLPARAEAPGEVVPKLRRGRIRFVPRRISRPVRLGAIIAALGLALLAAGILLSRATRRVQAPRNSELPPIAIVGDAPSSPPSPIPDDAVEFAGSYYKVFWERLSWPEAEEKCRLAGGRLACLETLEAQEFLADLKGEGNVVWVGGYRHRSGLWRWINGKGIVARQIGGVEEGFNHVAFTIYDDLNCRTTSGHAPIYASPWVEGYICEWPESSETEGSLPPFDLTLSEPVGDVRRFPGHGDYVTCVAFSTDGWRVATGSNDKTIRVWDVVTGREIWKSTAPKEMLRAVAFAPDGRTVYGCDLAGYRVLNAETGGLERSVDVRVWAGGVFSNDCSKLLARHPDGTLTVYSTRDGNAQHRGMERYTSAGLAFSADGQRIYYAAEGALTELSLTSKRVRPLGPRQGGYFEAIAASPNGNRLIWGSGRMWNGQRDVIGDRAVRVWDARAERLTAELQGHEGWLWTVAMSADGGLALSGGGGRPDDWYGHKPGVDASIRLWNVDARKLICKFDGHKNAILALAFSPDGKCALSGGADGTARLWRLPEDISSGE